MSTALKIIVDDFADFHEMRRVQRDTHGIYTLVFDQRWVINVEADPVSNIVSIFASPGSVRPDLDLPPDRPEMEWVKLSAADLPFGGRVGVHYPSGMVMLDSQADAAQLNTVAFRLWLMGFIDQLILWSKQVSPRKRAEGLLRAGPAATALAAAPETAGPGRKLTSQGSEA